MAIRDIGKTSKKLYWYSPIGDYDTVSGAEAFT